MSDEIRLTIVPDGDRLRLTVSGHSFAPAGKSYPRPLLNLPVEEINALRRGDATPDLARRVQAQVSQWLLADGLDVVLQMAIGPPGATPVRLLLDLDERVRADLAAIPFELMTPSRSTPFALDPRVASIVHLLPETGNPRAPDPPDRRPLRVLLLRSNPTDLGGAVPSAGPVRQAILAAGGDAGVEVDILSRETGDGVVGLPTAPALRERLRSGPGYDMLVYLGHGDLRDLSEGQPPVGMLLLESPDGSRHIALAEDRLAILLQNWPVPVVMLLGCLTAGLDAAAKEVLSDALPTWIRGSQGVAQALVNSAAGVQLAVGMRYRMEVDDVLQFAQSFFQSVLRYVPGHVEAAVRAARLDLHLFSNQAIAWSAPIVFRTPSPEPMFPFLTGREDEYSLSPPSDEAEQDMVSPPSRYNPSTGAGDAVGEAEQDMVSPPSSGAITVGTNAPRRWRLSESDKAALVARLLACPSIDDPGVRETVLLKLPARIRGAVRTSARADVHVNNIVTTCLNYLGGLEALLDAVRSFDEGTIQMGELDQFVGALAQQTVEPESTRPVEPPARRETALPSSPVSRPAGRLGEQPAMPPTGERIDQRRLRQLIVEKYPRNDLRVLCADVEEDLANDGVDLRVNLDIVGGERVQDIALNLIDYLDRRGRLPYLVAAVRRDWLDQI